VNIRFYIEPETGEPHIYEHNVREEEVEDILRHPGTTFRVEEAPASPSGRPRRAATCRSSMSPTPTSTEFSS